MIRLPVVAGAAGRSGTSTKTVAVTKRCVAIINPAGASGKSKKLWCSQLSHDVRQQLTSNGYVLEECFTAGPGSAARLTSDEAAAGADVVLAVGGDGTIHEVVSGLVQQQQNHQQEPTTALAVLPMGTGSDYARMFGWRLNDAAAACQRILSGEQQLIDVSVFTQQQQQTVVVEQPAAVQEANGPPHPAGADKDATTPTAAAGGSSSSSSNKNNSRYVVNVASCAVGALSAAKAGSLKQLGTLCYPLGGALTLLNWKGCSIQVCLDDSQQWQTLDKLTTLVLGQGRFWGGGLQILPEADPTDGLMDVVALQGLGLWDFISKGHLLRTGQHVNAKGVNVIGRCSRLQVRAAAGGAPLAWECDGEPQGQFEAVDIQVLPGALRLLSGKPAAPAAAAGQAES